MKTLDFAMADFGQEEKLAVNRVMQGNWLASGQENEQFEKEFAKYIGTKYAVCVNSGSSANLLALQALDLPKGSRVLTSACGFPATLAPILHLGLEPVLVDYDIDTHNIDINQVIDKIGMVDAVIFAHTLGNPVEVLEIKRFADHAGVRIVEDCCEAVGAGIGKKKLGSIGDLGTFSFYPAHQITALGGGGMITTNNKQCALRMRSLRDWGKIYDWDSYLGDHKTRYSHMINGVKYFKHYTYENAGYNMKLPEANAAFGRVQLKKLDLFNRARESNYNYLRTELAPLNDMFQFITLIKDASPGWFGFPLTLKNDKHNRNKFGDYLEENGIRTRPFFAGNITRHKPFIKYNGYFPIADKLMNSSLFIGVWQGLNTPELDYIVRKIFMYAESL